jgi:hypothetical protein
VAGRNIIFLPKARITNKQIYYQKEAQAFCLSSVHVTVCHRLAVWIFYYKNTVLITSALTNVKQMQDANVIERQEK